MGVNLTAASVLGLAVPAAVLAAALPARAAEGEKALSLSASYATFTVEQGPANMRESVSGQGGILGLDLQRGLSDTFWLRATVNGGVYDGPDGLTWAGAATAGITYAFDVVRYVPYVEAGAGVLVVSGGGAVRAARPVMELGAGLDVLESRSWSWGVGLRFDAFASRATYFTVGPRITWRWGYF